MALAFGAASSVFAQTPSIAPTTLPSVSSDPAALLSENLKALARDPYNVDALINAGMGALAVGDANAAFGFLARAEELSPSNARVKAGLGSALTMMEKSREALRLFDEASALGAPERDIASDRGLAHDLEGEGKKAQKDYLTALAAAPSDEVTRRLALSLGIAGERDAALARLDPLIRRNDQGAWRARAFILAMHGDMANAEKIVRMVAPPETAGSMVSFMQRLAGLSVGARAHAVHFGTLPTSGSSVVVASAADEGFRPVDAASAARLSAPVADRPAIVAAAQPLDPREARRQAKRQKELARLAEKGRGAKPADSTPAKPVSPEVAARTSAAMPGPNDRLVVVKGAKQLPLPDAVVVRSATDAAPRPTQVATVAAASSPLPSPLFEVPPSPPKRVVTQTSAPSSEIPATGTNATSRPAALGSPPPSMGSTIVPVTGPAAPLNPTSASVTPASQGVVAQSTPIQTASAQTAPAPSVIKPTEIAASSMPLEQPPVIAQTITPASTPSAASPSASGSAAPARPRLSLGEIVQTLELEEETKSVALPDEAKMKAARIAAQKKAAADEKIRAEKAAEEKRLAEEEAKAKRNPARIWVQVATGNNRAGLPGTWRKLKDQAPKALAKQSAWVAPFRQTNRMLVGPFKSAGDAREMVNNLGKEGVQATTFSSDPGQEIARIGGK